MICRKKRETTTSPLLFHPPLHRNKHKFHFQKSSPKGILNWEREKKIDITICDQGRTKPKEHNPMLN